MAFTRRGRGRSFTPRRRANFAWSEAHAFRRGPIAPGQIDAFEICDSATQLAVGLSPTLYRIRGGLYVDPDISPTPSGTSNPQFWVTVGAISVGPSALSSFASTVLSGENILWLGFIGAESRNTDWEQVGAGTQSQVAVLGQYWAQHRIYELDVKARRRLEEPQNKVWINIFANGANTSDVQWGGLFRCLVRVP